MVDDPRVAELLLVWEEQYENGQDIPHAELCSRCPQLPDVLCRQIAVLRHFDGLAHNLPAESADRAAATGSYVPPAGTDSGAETGVADSQRAAGMASLLTWLQHLAPP